MKIAFVHYNFGSDGVSRVVLNNVRGIKHKHPKYKVDLIGGSFELADSKLYNKIALKGINTKQKPSTKHELETKSNKIYQNLSKTLNRYDLVIVENATIGIFPIQTLAFKKYADSNKRVAYRVHDLVEEKPEALNYLKKRFRNYKDEICPDNTKHLMINSHSLNLLKKTKKVKTAFLPNSIIPEDYEKRSKEILESFRNQLIQDKILKENEKILLYPVRVIQRKNIEEALLINNILNFTKKQNYRLIVNIIEDRIPAERKYRKSLINLIQQKKMKAQLGGINRKYKFFNDSNGTQKYQLKDMFGISDTIITTSTSEGFGYCFLEPFLAEKPLIGRSLENNVQDFERNNISYPGLYNSLYINGKDFGTFSTKEKISMLEKLNNKKIEKIIKENKLEEKLKTEKRTIRKNKQKIIKTYNYIDIAELLLKLTT